MNFFEGKHLTAGYGKREVIQDISFSADVGELIGILGANGSGKTTLMKTLCGILPHKGTCQLEGVLLEELGAKQMARLCSYIPQRSGIAIDMTVEDFVLMGFNPRLGLLERPRATMKEEALQALALVGLEGKAGENYLHLSEGQKQLCGMARTLVSGSKLLLLDEPESSLDVRFRDQSLRLLRNWVACEQRAAIVTLHDPLLALNGCDRLLLMKQGNLLGEIVPKKDSLDQMEQMLCEIYGQISLQWCFNRRGEPQLVMLKEDEE